MSVSETATPDTEALERAVQVLRRGGVIALPTETVYGFSCLAHSEGALRRILALKGIEERRGLVALVPSYEDVERDLAPDPDERTLQFLRQAWPAPMSAIVRVRHQLPWGETRNQHETAAYRVPAHPKLRSFLERVGAPVVSTSANRTGQPPLQNPDEIERVFGPDLDWILREDWGLAPSTEGRRASTLLDCTSWPPRVLRAGGFDLQAVLRPGQDRG